MLSLICLLLALPLLPGPRSPGFCSLVVSASSRGSCGLSWVDSGFHSSLCHLLEGPGVVNGLSLRPFLLLSTVDHKAADSLGLEDGMVRPCKAQDTGREAHCDPD